MYLFKFEVLVTVYLFPFLLFMVTSVASDDNDPQPLFLTPYLKAGKISEAQKQSQTNIGGRISYTGYFTTNDSCGNHLFFWFIPAKNAWESAPVLLWLNGGPGATSMFGLFVEVGPWRYTKCDGFFYNNYTWTTDYNVIFVDQPVGTGYSFTDKGCYATNIDEVSENMYTALTQFFTMFPNLQKNVFFLTGESYAGHYIPALAVTIHKKNLVSKPVINLIGILVGNAYMDMGCDTSTELSYQLGIIDEERRELENKIQDQIIRDLKDKNYAAIANISYPPDTSNLPSAYNIMYEGDRAVTQFEYTLFIKDVKTRKLIHVGYTTFGTGATAVPDNLAPDRYLSQASSVEFLLKTGKYIVGFYTGNLDTVVPVTSVSCVLRGIQWSGAAEFLRSKHIPWWVSGRLAGWTNSAGNLLEVVVRGSGHFVPTDQGQAALAMLKTVVSSKPGHLIPFNH